MLPPLLSANTTYVYAVINFYVNAYCLKTDSQNIGTNIWNDVPTQLKTEWSQFIVFVFPTCTPGFVKAMTSNRFRTILSHLHISNAPTRMFEFDKMFKLRPVPDKIHLKSPYSA